MLTGIVASLDGKTVIRVEQRGNSDEAAGLGAALAEDALGQGAGELLKSY